MPLLCDWGTTRLRLFRTEDGRPVEERHGPGLGQPGASSPAAALLSTLGPWREEAQRHGLVCCGMAGARGGLAEQPYLPCPVDAPGWTHRAGRTSVDGISVIIASGLNGTNFLGRPDVMRGEETQIFGALALDPSLARGRRVMVLPGTHSKWVELVDGSITRLHSVPTGELFASLRDHSILIQPEEPDAPEDDDGLDAGIARSASGVLPALFEARAARLAEGRDPRWAQSFLSAMLVASEFRTMSALIAEDGPDFILIGSESLTARYAHVAGRLGLATQSLDGQSCVIAGLNLIRLAGEP